MKNIFTYLIATTALIIISAAAMAQGGANPWAGSTHGYKVNPGNSGNNYLWEIDGGTAGTHYTVNSANMSGDSINITWNTAADGNSYTLRFTETDKTTLQCATVKELTINVQSNTFEVSTSDLDNQCNSAVDTTNPSLNVMTLDFPIAMTTGTTWSPSWEATFTISAGTGSPTIGTVTSTDGTLTNNGSGSYTLSGIASSAGNGSATVSVTIAGDAFTLLETSLTITAAKELTYNTPDTDSGDWGATAAVNPIPNTSSIITD